MAIVINGNGIDIGNNPISNVDVGVLDNNAATAGYVKSNGDVNAVTSFSQISGTNEIVGVELTNDIHNIFNDGSNIATYQLNGNANDLGGTYNGTASNVNYEEGKFGLAGKFNGSSYISTGIVTNPSVVTFSLFVKFNVLTNGQIILSKRSIDGSTYGRGFNLFLANNKIEVEENNGVSGTANIVSNENIVTGEWYHIVLERNTTLNKLIINKINNSTGAAKIFLEGTSGLNIGGGAAAGLRYYTAIGFNGLIDQVRIFNRALTESEINTLYTETLVSANAQLNISQGTFIYPKGLGARGYIKSSDVFTGTVDVSAQTDGWKYVAKDENNNFSFYTDKPTIGKKSTTLYLENGKLWSQGAGIIPDGSTNTSTTKVTPDMTSNSQGGFIVSASSEYSTNFQAYKAFDGLDSSQWWETSGSVNTSGYLQVQLPAAKVINKYSILPPKDTVTNSPKSWTIQASNTGAFAGEQVTLDTRSNITGYVAGVPKYFTFINGNQYLYYRIVISENNGATKLGISEFQLIEAQVSTGDGFPITPISFLSNKVRIASGVAVELAPSDISKTVSESLEASSYFGKNAVVAYASIDMTTTPPTILDSYNVASVIRSSNGVGKITLITPTDKGNITAICGSNSVAGTITATTKNEVSFATGATNYAKTSVIVIGGKF